MVSTSRRVEYSFALRERMAIRRAPSRAGAAALAARRTRDTLFFKADMGAARLASARRGRNDAWGGPGGGKRFVDRTGVHC